MNTTTCPGGAALKPSQRLLDAGLTHYTCSVCGAPCDEHTSSGGQYTNDPPNDNAETSMNTLTLNDKTYTLNDELADRIKAELEAQEAKPKRWRADDGDSYWFLSEASGAANTTEFTYDIDQERYDIGNYFKTKAEAEAYRDRLLAEQVIRDSSDFVPDWSDGEQFKFFVNYRHKSNKLDTDYWGSIQAQSLAFYRSEKEAQAAIADPKVRKAYLTVFGVKDAA